MSFFFNDTATTEIYTLSLHDALPIYRNSHRSGGGAARTMTFVASRRAPLLYSNAGACFEQPRPCRIRSEEHTSELQSRENLVCRLLLEKKKKVVAETHRDNSNVNAVP